MYKRDISDEWDFRTSNTKEFTHCYHNYPAMMIPQIARRLIKDFAPKGELKLIFDPYMGSGTTLVEASLMGINSIGTDINPLAKLISKVKTTHYDLDIIKALHLDIRKEILEYSHEKVVNKDFEHITNSEFWYAEDSLFKLSFLTQLLENIDKYNRDFFTLCLAEVIREVSFTRNGEFKRFRMKLEKIDSFKPDTFKIFESKIHRNITGLKEYNKITNSAYAKTYDFNSSLEIPKSVLENESVDLVVTSPPYGDSRTTVAYGQFSRWANEWFKFENAKNLDSLLMGGKVVKKPIFKTNSIKDELKSIEEIDSKRYLEVVSFLNDYYNSIKNVSSLIRKGGRICYVVGNRNVKGIQISLDYFTVEIFEQFGFKHDFTFVRSIPNKRMPSKTSPTNQAGAKVGTMVNEFIVIMTKL
jgi:DNA modification methylase